MEDVTGYVRLQQEQEAGHDRQMDLEVKVTQMESELFRRSHDLGQANEKLREANEDLVAANRRLQESCKELETFAYSVSHDLRGQLMVINGLAQIAIEDNGAKLGPAGCDPLRRIMRCTERLGRMSDDVLAYSRATRQDLTLGPVAVEPLIDYIVSERPDLQPPRPRSSSDAPCRGSAARKPP